MKSLQELKNIIAKLRGSGGCPWDREQTHKSVCEYLIEETSELLDTIDRDDKEHMKEELGDVLMHVYFHAQLEEENGNFTIEDVAAVINEKLVRRHPHVFGDIKLQNSAEVYAQWEKIKLKEKKNGAEKAGVFKNLPPRLPALLYARDVFKQIRQKKLNAVGIVDEKSVEAISEDLNEESAGKKLFEIAAACREAKIDPESALRRYSDTVVKKIEEKNEKA